MAKRDLVAVPECDNEETGEHTCWSMKMQCNNINHYIWITKYDEKEYIVEDSHGHNLVHPNKVYKTLSGAKRAAEATCDRQERLEFFTD